jgi:hypothetical protein
MALPRELHIGKQGQLETTLAAEVETLRGKEERGWAVGGAPFRVKLPTLRRELHVPIDFKTGAVIVRLIAGGATVWALTVDVAGNAVRCGDLSFPLPSLPWPRPSLQVFVDGSVIETFIADRETLTSRVYAMRPGETELEVSVEGNRGVLISQWPLEAISKDRLTT